MRSRNGAVRAYHRNEKQQGQHEPSLQQTTSTTRRADGKLSSTYLCQRHLLAPAEERSRILQQRLDLLLNHLDHLARLLLLGLLALRAQDLEQHRHRLAGEGVDEEGDPGAGEGRGGGGVRGGQEGRGEGVGEELGDDGGFGHGG